jgi:predicted phosphohydrolase
MKLQYASDLHIEFPENKQYLAKNPITPVGDILILAGDIVLFSMLEKHMDFFKYVADNFSKTYWIPGNHEYYQSDICNRSGIVFEAILPNVFLVNNITVNESDVQLIFSTLWSYIRPENQIVIKSRLNDYSLITNNGDRLTTAMSNELHTESKKFILQELQKGTNEKTVVVTHHVPTFENYPDVYKTSNLNDAFTVELGNEIEKYQPYAWIYGHSHYNTKDFTIGKTQMCTNQLGYVQYNEQKDYTHEKIVVV